MTEYKLVVVGGKLDNFFIKLYWKMIVLFVFLTTAGGVGKSALTIQLIQNQ
jgi:GTPase SAR1 family protein